MRKIFLSFLLLASLFLFTPTVASAASPSTYLKKLKVTSERTSGYDRDLFNHWTDADGDGCDTRDEVLYRQNTASGKSCGDDEGRWKSVYDNLSFTDSSDLDVDHMVPLAEAYGSGAYRWSSGTKERFANDMYKYSLIAVSASSNRSKSDQDPAEWLPTKKSYTCRYLASFTVVKYRWSLTVDSREKRSIKRGLSKCSTRSIRLALVPRAKVNNTSKPDKPSLSGNDPRCSTCSEATANGYGPYQRGIDPEYDWYRDGDSDGTVCE